MAVAAAARPRGLALLERLGGLTPSGRAGVPIAWALYDFANTVYSYAVVSYAMGLWTVRALGPADGQFWFGIANAASVGLNALVSPVLGAMSAFELTMYEAVVAAAVPPRAMKRAIVACLTNDGP